MSRRLYRFGIAWAVVFIVAALIVAGLFMPAPWAYDLAMRLLIGSFVGLVIAGVTP